MAEAALKRCRRLAQAARSLQGDALAAALGALDAAQAQADAGAEAEADTEA
ncbi:MAG: 30S ribosomal protein S16, partial [Massilia sp.]|nr:30S ribosomal protein S16 [Massilia sp.]